MANKKLASNNRIKIVYLIGTGLTNATALRQSYPKSMVNSGILKDIVKNLHNYKNLSSDKNTGPIINDLNSLNEDGIIPNLEELVDLLESSGIKSCKRMSEILSNDYRKLLQDHTKKIIEDLSVNLAEIIIDFHLTQDNPESLIGILTTNYDTLIEYAFKSMKIKPDFGFITNSNENEKIPLLKLHGSIDWLHSIPIHIVSSNRVQKKLDTVWIEPGRSKECAEYPFNIIWGKAREMLAKADIVRIIGCSLLASDWHLVKLLFKSTFLDSVRANKKCIQVINFVGDCDRIKNTYSLLSITPIYEIEEVVKHIRASSKGTSWDDEITQKDIEDSKNYMNKINNPVDFWLQSVIQMLINNRKSIHTNSNKLANFINNYGE